MTDEQKEMIQDTFGAGLNGFSLGDAEAFYCEYWGYGYAVGTAHYENAMMILHGDIDGERKSVCIFSGATTAEEYEKLVIVSKSPDVWVSTWKKEGCIFRNLTEDENEKANREIACGLKDFIEESDNFYTEELAYFCRTFQEASGRKITIEIDKYAEEVTDDDIMELEEALLKIRAYKTQISDNKKEQR